jgi:E3 ubiquitin-protein ligase UBR2
MLVDEKEREKKRLASERRKKVMDQMKNAQKNFMKENKQLFDDTVQKRPRLNTESEPEVTLPIPAQMTGRTGNDEDPKTEVALHCLGPQRANPVAAETQYFTCILCQDEEELTAQGKALVMAAFLQKSTVLSNRRQQSLIGFGGGKSNAIEASLPLLPSDLHCCTHTSSCGHVMHASCWKTYFEDVQNSERNRSRLRSPQSFSVLKQVRFTK